jgi:DNA-directed RNA polymerase subunit RPC12/RpoP
MIYGCHKCLAIFRPDFLHLEDHKVSDDDLRCPNCGDYAMELGYEPGVTMRDEGLWYLCDETHMMGPYPNPTEARKDLWAWFGGAHAKGSEEGGKREGPVPQGAGKDDA